MWLYDVKYSFNVGSSTDKLLNIITDNPFTIKKIDDINWEAIDTLIIGHTRSLLNSIMNDDEFLVKLLNDAQERKKNVYSFDELPVQFKNNEQFRSPNLSIWEIVSTNQTYISSFWNKFTTRKIYTSANAS